MNKSRVLLPFSLFIFVLVSFTTITTVIAKKAVVIVPVADLVGSPLINNNTAFGYNNIPLASGKTNRSYFCPRVHQLIFNEIVDILEEQKNEARIAIPNVYYLTTQGTEPQNIYWIQKKNIIPLEQLESKGLDTNKIPAQIDFNNNGKALSNNNIVTLVFPWVDPVTQQTFSVGTRFVLAHEQPHKNYYSIFVFEPNCFTFRETELPKSHAIRYHDLHTNKDRITYFINILRKWVHPDNGFIPYVWGGCSFIHVCKNDTFTKQTVKNNQHEGTFYNRNESKTIPKIGFDCSCLVTRAAQICGIPYFFKNSTTLCTKLDELKKGESLQEGDLMWVPGHVMVVASLPNNTIIEARGYPTGFGKVHELPLHRTFKNINSYADLLHHYFNNKPLYWLDKEGKINSTLQMYKLLKLASVWEH